MLDIYLVVILSVSFSLVSLLVMRYFAEDLGLVDVPCSRKNHIGDIPLVGGMSVFIAIGLSIIFFIKTTQELNLFLIASSLMVFIGVLDDKHDLTVRSRFIGQFLISAILIFGVGKYIETFGNIFSFGDVSLGAFGIPVTFLAVIAAINAFNMVDGIDGLLASCAIVAFSGLAYFFHKSNDQINFLVCITIIFSLIPFLFANFAVFPFSRKKIFMGDAGSMLIGLAVVWFLVLGSQPTANKSPAFSPVIALYIISIPLMDMIAVIFRRLKSGKSPTKPGRDHAHHLLMKYGLSTKKTLFTIIVGYIFILSAGIILESFLLEHELLIAFFLFFVLYILSMNFIGKRIK
ncbi:undecaprenyl-phosphate alpha-N-acetylglucosaminyl 1-phosphate transferase [Pseudoalteromonas piscicida]|uniref:undecaprenyl-phosphate alpha-N-acetylglucosaminyl 1-phosphate transferase n=1 Tax=Pseudoalteromonas piscicida TaxID=43662 RepID=UPI00309C5D8D